MAFTEATAPAHWAPYLINGDASGFDFSSDPADEEACYAMERELGHCVDAESAGFVPYPDYGEAGECCVFTFQAIERRDDA